MAALEIRVLGTFEARLGAGGERLLLHSRKLSGLLAYLAMSPGVGQPRETLATLLWDRSAEEQARASLRQGLAVLRKSIALPGVEILVAGHDRIALVPDAVWVDALEFQRLVADGTPAALQQAVTLYRGRFLEGLSVESEVFEDWARAEGQRLQDLAMRALTRLLAHHRDQGAADAAIELAHRVLAIDPLHEDAHRTLIGLYVRQGARGEALKQYERYREMLQRELGLEPDAETRQLAQQLSREQEPPVAAAPVPPGRARHETAGAQIAGEGAPRGAQSDDAAREAQAAPSSLTGRCFVTMMSCSLVEASALSTRLDPEDLRHVIAGFEDCCKEVVERHGGHILHYVDHAVTACFGYPRADEHAPERAARAALDIVAAVGLLPSVCELELRASIGIASGQVVVGRRVLEGGVVQETIAGETPHVVAGLRAAAPPGSVVIGESTRQLLGELFECDDLGPRRLEGFVAPMRIWRVLEERTEQDRLGATRRRWAHAPLIGREEEIELLRRRWERAKTGSGQVVVLVGEPGIGKSRLIEELRELLAGETHWPLGYYCSPHHGDSALYPLIRQLEHAAGYAHEDPPARKLEKLEALLAQAGGNLAAEVPLVAALLSMPTGDRYPPMNLAPHRQKEKTLEALDAQLVGLTKTRPVLMVFENVHWSDPATREVLERLVDLVQRLPVLMLVTQRPGPAVSRAGEAHVTSLVLKRLARSDAEALVAELAGERGLPKEVLDRIVEKADGVPLFIEELTRNALEAGAADDGSRRDLAGRSARAAEIGIPDTLYDLLLARLDRLGPAKAVAQEGAVIGRRFSYELLAAVSTRNEAELQAALAGLADAEIVFARGRPPAASYFFRHALIRDAAYASLARTDRGPLHARVAQALEERFPESREMEPEVLGLHFAQAGRQEKAVYYWQKAGELAARRWAYREAIAHLDKALALQKTLPDTTERHGRELELQVLLGQTWILAAGYTVPQVEAAFERARELCEELGDSHQLFFVLLGLWQLYAARQELPRASAAAERLSALASSEQNRDFAIEAHVAHIVTRFTLGEFEQVLAHANEAIALRAPDEQSGHILSAGYDGRVISLTGASWSLWTLGLADRALSRMQEALATARKLGHPYSQTMALYCSAWLHVFRREPRAALEHAEQAIALSIEHGFVWTQAFAAVLHGWALAEEGRMAEGIDEIRGSLAALEQMGHRLWRPHQQGLLAAACARAGQTDEALAVIRAALEVVERTGDCEHAAELHRQQGELMLRQAAPGAAAAAEQCFGRAIEIARSQKAKSWELRAATDLARLWREQGKCGQAHDLLASVYDGFTEGFDTPDLRDARALLDELAEAAGSSSESLVAATDQPDRRRGDPAAGIF